jgi:Zn finger protein HypA/HybF involved in hydrogenase expression
MRKRKSKYTKEMLSPIVKKSLSYREVIRRLGYSSNSGSMFYLIKRKISEFEIDITHFKLSRNKGVKIPLDQILVKGSTYNRYRLKERIIKNNIVKNECAICGMGPEWQGKTLVLTLDHENGIFNDNEKDNLRLVCPNCNSQLSTFAGRNSSNKNREKRHEIKQT